MSVEKFVRLHKSALRTIDFVVGISRGGLIPAALIATRLDKPLVAIYVDRQDHVYLDRKAWLRDKRVLLIDDIVRTGATLEKMIALLRRAGTRSIHTFTLFCLRSASVRPTWATLIDRDQKMPWDF